MGGVMAFEAERLMIGQWLVGMRICRSVSQWDQRHYLLYLLRKPV